ncbi:TetR/AcrR family transcriptional regulator C-terminal domain-containing protein [Gordonia sp. HY285]|uniref:TetR/AcrR family transcriptional regulator n=1 Tax=Gordonia liuliyuniae TaxID=2911517 RepID=UPI001F01FDF3|nr:TetR/AcrR family transcriptional regulator C-terminal domain-containing protein [Gordonia liuliyuniae]MCF8610952.1 TetR/AcrR family transcriptional regulator C-terminal domain-containing protein [Gordonia liuliyuniae]
MPEPRGGHAEASNVWLRPQRSRRGEPPVTSERIVEVAVEILDAGGLEALTMRRVAEQLGVVAPSLYWHVKTKDDIIDLAVDHAFAETDAPTAAQHDDWRTCIEAIALAWRATLVDHPWVAPVAASRPSFGPSYLDQLELVMSTLHRAGLDGAELSAAMWTLHNLIFGSASTEATLNISDHDREVGQALLQEHADRYPTLSGHRYLDDDDWLGDFTRGLAYFLDGLKLRIRAQPEPTS